MILAIIAILGLALAAAWAGGEDGQLARWRDQWEHRPRRSASVSGQRVGIIAGHMGYDSGAVCPDGLSEADTVQEIAERVVTRLRRAGAKVELLGEYDGRLPGYQADALVSIHADSCIERSGFKVAHLQLAEQDAQASAAAGSPSDALVDCLSQTYAQATGLAFDYNSITEDMTGYHAFKRIAPETPAAIIEAGFLGGDHQLLTEQPDLAARGIAEGIVCFLELPKF